MFLTENAPDSRIAGEIVHVVRSAELEELTRWQWPYEQECLIGFDVRFSESMTKGVKCHNSAVPIAKKQTVFICNALSTNPKNMKFTSHCFCVFLAKKIDSDSGKILP